MKTTVCAVTFLGAINLLLSAASSAQGFTLTTFAGGGSTDFACSGEAATQVVLSQPGAVATDSAGNLYIADTGNNRVCKVSGGVITTVAGVNAQGQGTLNQPFGVAVDGAGNVYIADTDNNVVRKVSGGNMTIFAGTAGVPGYIGDGGQATSAELSTPFGLAVDTSGNVYIADTENHVVRKVSTDGIITTFAGGGGEFYSGDGGPATSAGLANVTGVAIDSGGNLYIAAPQSFRIRKVTPDGTINTVAGNGQDLDSGDGGPATSAGLASPQSVAVDSSGNLYIADTETSFIREVLANGTILTAAGGATPVLTGSGGNSSIAGISLPMSVAVSANGVYVADTHNDRVLLLSTQASTGSPSIGTGGIVSASGFGDFAAAAPGSFIEIYGSNLAKDTRPWASSDFNGVNAPTSLDGTSVTIGGLAAFVDYISPDQVNAQVPSGVGTGPQPVIVTTATGSTAPSNITINQTEPGLLAPTTFNAGGKQYVVALFGDGLTYVLPPGAISSLTSREAVPGDEIVLYGVGFGPVTPNIPAGQMEEASNSLAASFQISIENVPATVKYAGLAPGYVGLYQFNIVVPNVAANDTAALTFSLGGQLGSQTLYIAVGN
ncbi:MAG: hypothetical protein JOZ32_13720 [Bryobacterales bacterium]|nr:hypothetical protein [Bryobacterales bacterium]